ncbi:MAG: hypothetical protein NT051_00970 [Candidatus Micrarchaeota archaeon]|nr:hypothetical protein [Candidatus Micrarchaeota archaeon]
MFVFQTMATATKDAIVAKPLGQMKAVPTPTIKSLVDKFTKVQQVNDKNEHIVVNQASALLNKIHSKLPAGNVKEALKDLKDPKISEGLGPFTNFSARPMIEKDGNKHSIKFVLGGEVYGIKFLADKQDIKITGQSVENRR